MNNIKIINAPIPDLSFQDKLRAQLSSIKTWESYSEFDKPYATNRFMNNIGRLFLDYFQFHLDQAETIGVEFAQEILSAERPLNFYYVYPMASKLERLHEWHDPWEEACWAATNIEAFHTMFSSFVPELDVERIWKYMEEMRDSQWVQPDKRPKKVPSYHWWWFVNYEIHKRGETNEQ